ncbi:MAG TPA: hypothetical protein VF723_04795 [Pyrinomonadaceae bacterium]|jgi:hypothetical protein
MPEAANPEPDERAAENNTAESKDPEATSTDTLSDIEETEKAPESGEGESKEGGRSSVPSPDGAFGEGADRGGDDAGPM